MSDIIKQCPQCGRRLTKISPDGNIGFCDYHKEWFAFSPEAEGEASEANRKYKEELQRIEDEKKRKKLQEERDLQAKARRVLACRIAFLFAGVLVIVLAVLWFKVIPEKHYRDAEALFDEGRYKEAAEVYSELNGYADSASKAAMCSAFEEIEKGSSDNALAILTGDAGAPENEAFQIIYDTMYQKCSAHSRQEEGLSEWDEFGSAFEPEIAKYGLKKDFSQKSSGLKLAYADELSREKDPRCAELYKELSDQGLDITENVMNAIDNSVDGLCRIQLRELLISEAEANGTDSEAQKDLIKQELIQYLNERDALGISAADSYVLLQKAAEYEAVGADIYAIAEELGLEEANSAYNVSDHLLIDIDKDDNSELVIAAEDGSVHAFSIFPGFSELASAETLIQSPSIEEIDGLLLMTADDGSGFSTVSVAKDGMKVITEQIDIIDLQRQGTILTFGKELEGSVRRSVVYSYSLEDPETQPDRTDIDWGKNSYKYPETPEDTVFRFLEARGYQIKEEEDTLLAADALSSQGFTNQDLASLPVPDMPVTASVSAYDTEDSYVLLETIYSSSGKNIIRYFAAAKDAENDEWKIAGTKDEFAPGMEDAENNLKIPLIAINSEITGHLENKEDTDAYRVLIPETSKVQIVWKAGEKNGNATAFTAALYSADNMTDCIISYDLRLSTSKQMGTPLFLPAGVYYIQISAERFEDTDYMLALQAEEAEYFETENNNSFEKANEIVPGQVYSGSLFEKEDVDWFRFTIEQPGAAQMILSSTASTAKQSLFTGQLLDSTGNRIITSFELPGTQEKARSGIVYLGTGEYYIQILKGAGWSSFEYQVELSFDEKENTEMEVNDSFETATPVSINQDITGSFGTAADIDYYSFTIENDMIIQPKLTFSPLETSAKTYALTLCKDNTVLYSVKLGGKESGKLLSPYPLSAGTYYVKMENPNFTEQDYMLHLAAMTVDHAENEPDDVLAGANEIEFGTAVSGVLSTEEDIDYYKLSFEKDTVITLNLEYAPTSGSGTAYILQLEQNGKKLWSQNISGASGGTMLKLQIPAGDNYLKIKAGTWTSTVYTLTISL